MLWGSAEKQLVVRQLLLEGHCYQECKKYGGFCVWMRCINGLCCFYFEHRHAWYEVVITYKC